MKMKMMDKGQSARKLLLAVTAVMGIVTLQGCATPHACPLTNEDGYCADMSTTYGAAVANAGDNENALAGSGLEAKQESGSISTNEDDYMFAHNSAPVTKTAAVQPPSGLKYAPTQIGYEDRPIYAPARPARIWVAPWRDDNNILHYNEYIAATREGGWHYGELRNEGAASDLLAPLDPNNLGFKPLPPEVNKEDETGKKRVQPKATLGIGTPTTPSRAPAGGTQNMSGMYKPSSGIGFTQDVHQAQ